MIRSLQENKGGLGTWTRRPETDEERAELQSIFPKHGLPAGVVQSFGWNEHGHLVITTQQDPNYVEPAVATPESSNNDRIEPVPSPGKLADWKIDDLVTKAAELGVAFRPGEKKAELIARLIPAWTKRNEELRKPAK